MYLTPSRMRAVQMVANNWTMRARAPRVCALARALGYDVPVMNNAWGYSW